MNMKKILSFLEENKQLKIQVERLKDSLLEMAKEFKNKSRYLNSQE
jgi:regulator of replication initiation timing